jgi:hypothetical protein
MEELHKFDTSPEVKFYAQGTLKIAYTCFVLEMCAWSELRGGSYLNKIAYLFGGV